jgi:hypothetical protein
MSLSQETMLDLMAYADGELDESDVARVEKLLEESDEARRVLEGMTGELAAGVSEWVAHSQDERAAKAGADSIADAVMSRAVAGGATVASLEDARKKREVRTRVAIAVAAIAAVAAAVFLYVGGDKGASLGEPAAPVASGGPTPTQIAPPPAPMPLPLPSEQSPEQVAAGGPPPEVTIESTTSHDVSVTVVPAAANMNGAASVIVWIGDDPTPKGK